MRPAVRVASGASHVDVATPWDALNRGVRDHLGEEFDYTPDGGSAGSVFGDFSTETRDFEGDEGVPVTTADATLWLLSADLPAGFAPRQGDIAVRKLDGVRYRVADVRAEDDGGAVLILRKAP